MSSTNLKMVLNMTRLLVLEKLNKARNVHDAITTNLILYQISRKSFFRLKSITCLKRF